MLPKILQASAILFPVQPHTDIHQGLFSLIGHWIFRIREATLRLRIEETRVFGTRSMLCAYSYLISGPAGQVVRGSYWYSHMLKDYTYVAQKTKMPWTGICGRLSPVPFCSVWKMLPKSNHMMNTRKTRDEKEPFVALSCPWTRLFCELLMAKELEDGSGAVMVSTA